MRLITLLSLIILTSCASRPVLYPNNKLKNVGKEQANQDINICMEEAEAYLDSPTGKNILKGAGGGSLIGGAMGAVSGIFRGDIVGRAVRGAAIGGAGGGAAGALTPDTIKKRYVNSCLQKKGYRLLGWD